MEDEEDWAGQSLAGSRKSREWGGVWGAGNEERVIVAGDGRGRLG